MWPSDILTWLKLGGALAAVLAIGALCLHYRALEADAALVPGLEQHVASDDSRANALAAQLAAANAARDSADHALTAWQANKTELIDAIEKEGHHATAATDAHCAPGDADRKLRNDALAKLAGFGQAAGAARLP